LLNVEPFDVNSTAAQNLSVVPACSDVNATQDEANVINATDDFTAIYLAIGIIILPASSLTSACIILFIG